MTKLYKTNSEKTIQKILTMHSRGVIILNNDMYNWYYAGVFKGKNRTEQVSRIEIAVHEMNLSLSKSLETTIFGAGSFVINSIQGYNEKD